MPNPFRLLRRVPIPFRYCSLGLRFPSKTRSFRRVAFFAFETRATRTAQRAEDNFIRLTVPIGGEAW
jgi:hypothetical protein